VRARRSAAFAAAALVSGGLLGACGGSGDVSRDGLADDVAEYLVDPAPNSGRDPLSEAAADTVATCVANAVFDDSGDDPFTRDERNEIGKAQNDGEAPDPEVEARFEELFEDCLAEADSA
jgi:hypothetical protein